MTFRTVGELRAALKSLHPGWPISFEPEQERWDYISTGLAESIKTEKVPPAPCSCCGKTVRGKTLVKVQLG